MRIPASFQLFGQTITVAYVPSAFVESDGCHGFASYRLNQIQLRPDNTTYPVARDQLEQAFLHELTHLLLVRTEAAATMSPDKPLHGQEGFVDLFSELLHQALSTFSGELL